MPEPAGPPLPRFTAALALSRFVAAMPNLATALGMPVLRHFPGRPIPAGACVLAWGRKASGLAAERFAARRGLPVLHVEDGFVRSVFPGRAHPPLSISLDDRGVYYDAYNPSRLEILAASPRTPDALARAARLAALWRGGRISKYNHAREYPGELPEPFVLAIDQTFGDGSIRHGMAGPQSFTRMLEAALDEHPDKTVILKVHPEVVSGKKRGHFDMVAVSRLDRVRVFSGDVHPAGLLERAAAVYAVTSQVGFEGLLWGRPVSVFGMPFYAGWGLTRDALAAPARRGPIRLEQLVCAALADYPRYVDPETGEPCDPERVMEWMGLQRRQRERFPGAVAACGFPGRRHPGVRRVFQAATVRFAPRIRDLRPGEALAVPAGDEAADVSGAILRVRDGFFPGLGLDGGPGRPLCALVDGAGPGIETILGTAPFPPGLLERARRLRRDIVDRGLTVLPDGDGGWTRPAGAARVALAVGESCDPEAEQAFLDAVCKKDAADLVIYKPLPHILGKIRQRIHAGQGRVHFQEITPSASMHRLLFQVDAVHVRTSSTGIDALLREREVLCHGRPFYAGWGLTDDVPGEAGRPRPLSLDEFVAGLFFLYPVCVSGVTGCYTGPERLLDEMSHGGDARRGRLARTFSAMVARFSKAWPG
jgi:capsular polysaccharide export protein